MPRPRWRRCWSRGWRLSRHTGHGSDVADDHRLPNRCRVPTMALAPAPVGELGRPGPANRTIDRLPVGSTDLVRAATEGLMTRTNDGVRSADVGPTVGDRLAEEVIYQRLQAWLKEHFLEADLL